MTTETLDPDACYRAASGRDARFDGRFVLAVVTTGIYCRPSCPARTPLRHNCRFFPTAAAAVAAGFRSCRRCRPHALPGSRQWDVRGDLASRAVRLIRDGAVDETGVAGLAAGLAVSERHLHRVLLAEVGASAQQLNRTRRAQTARLLVEQTPMPLTDVAFAAGFASVRQFNDVMRQEFGVPPSALRRGAARLGPAQRDADRDGQVADEGPAVVLRLRYRRPLATEPLRRFLAGHTVAGLERHDAATGEHTRTVRTRVGDGSVTVRLTDDPEQETGAAGDTREGAQGHGSGVAGEAHLAVRLQLAGLGDVATVVARVRRWLDLDADPALVDGALAKDGLLAPLVRARPGMRVPGAVDGYETAVLAVLGQHVSLAAARTFAARLVAAYGSPAVDGLTAFPAAEVLAGADPEDVRAAMGVTRARGRTVHALACASADGLQLVPGAEHAEVRARLLALPGIGPWTADYVSLRCLGDPDSFLPDDLVLKRALGARSAFEATARAEPWRPWRAYALLHLWTSEVFA